MVEVRCCTVVVLVVVLGAVSVGGCEVFLLWRKIMMFR